MEDDYKVDQLKQDYRKQRELYRETRVYLQRQRALYREMGRLYRSLREAYWRQRIRPLDTRPDHEHPKENESLAAEPSRLDGVAGRMRPALLLLPFCLGRDHKSKEPVYWI